MRNVHSNHRLREPGQSQIESVNPKLLSFLRRSRIFWKDKMLGKDNNRIWKWENLKSRGNCLESLLYLQIAKKFGKIARRELRVFTLQRGLEVGYGREVMLMSNLWVHRTCMLDFTQFLIVHLKNVKDSFPRNYWKMGINKVN